MNFQMFKLVLEKAEEPETKLPTSAGSLKKQESRLVRLPQISCFTLSLKCFLSESDSCSDVGIGPLLQFPYPLRADPVLLTLLFFPLDPSPY